MTNKIKMPAVNEVLAAFVGAEVNNPNEIKTDPKAYIIDKYGVNVGADINLNIVENNTQTNHLTLPYYPEVTHCVNALSDDELEMATGALRVVYSHWHYGKRTITYGGGHAEVAKNSTHLNLLRKGYNVDSAK